MVDELRQTLEKASESWGDQGAIQLPSGLAYRQGDPVVIEIRKRGHRYDLSDEGAAVRKAGARGWLPFAEARICVKPLCQRRPCRAETPTGRAPPASQTAIQLAAAPAGTSPSWVNSAIWS
jgi:hypothetical protein